MALINISIKEIEKVINKKVHGVIHIGANVGEEGEEYRSNGIKNIVWIEPLDFGFSQLKKMEEQFGDKIFQCAISDKDGSAEMLVTNNIVSSSLRNLGIHSHAFPSVVGVQVVPVTTYKLDTLIEKHSIDTSLYNLLVIDTQGTEDLVLIGAKNNLLKFDAILTEVNDYEVYEGCKTKMEIVDYLGNIGFALSLRANQEGNPVQEEFLFINNRKQ